MLTLLDKTRNNRGTPVRRRYRLMWYVLGWIVAAAIAAAKIHLTNPKIADDAYITLKYSYNLIHHGAFTYNFPTSQLAGAETSPLYGLLLSPLLYFFSPVRTFDIMMVITVASSAVLLYELIRREWGVVAGFLAALILLLNDYLYATRGMETSLFIFACLATILVLHSLVQDLVAAGGKVSLIKAFLAGLLFAFTVFIRGEGILLILFPFIELLLAMRRNHHQGKIDEKIRLEDPTAFIEPRPGPIRATFETLDNPMKTLTRFILGGLMVTIPMAVLLQTQTGRFIPGTLLAKEAQARSGFWGKGWLYYTIMESFIKLNPWHYEIYALALLAAIGLLIVLISKSHWKTSPLTLTIIAFALIQLVAYGNILVVPFYHWYMGPQVLAVSALAAIATSFVVTQLRKRITPKILALPVMALFIYFAFSSITLIGSKATPWRQQSYMEAAAWLKTNTPANSTVASSEIGYLGYYSDRYMIDYVGLLSTQSAEWVGQGNLFYWIYYYQPDYWVVHNPPWSLEEATRLPWFKTAYTPVATFKGLTIYHKVGIVPKLPTSQKIFRQLSEVPWKTS